MACRIPVIATASEGALEIIENGVNGKLVLIAEYSALASSILELLEGPDKRLQFSLNGRSHVESKFPIERMVEETLRFYELMLRKKNQTFNGSNRLNSLPDSKTKF